MQAAQGQGTVSQEVARQTDGVLLAVGALSSILKKKVDRTLHCYVYLTPSFLPCTFLQPHCIPAGHAPGWQSISPSNQGNASPHSCHSAAGCTTERSSLQDVKGCAVLTFPHAACIILPYHATPGPALDCCIGLSLSLLLCCRRPTRTSWRGCC